MTHRLRPQRRNAVSNFFLAEPAGVPNPSPMSKRAAKRNLRVVLIDDDTELCDVVVDSLRNAGIDAWALRPTPSGSIDDMALAVATFRPHAILIDVVMPTDTPKLVRALRAEPLLKGARLFGCSGHAALATSFSGMLDGFLHKPFRMEDLADLLAEEFAPPPPKPKSRGKPRVKRARA